MPKIKPVKENIETVSTPFVNKIPKKNIMLNDKLANSLTQGFLIDEGPKKMQVSKKWAKNQILTPIMLSYEGNVTLTGRQKWTPYDRAVHNGVVTLYEADNTYVTADSVYRAMNGLTESEWVSPQSKAAVTRSLDKSRRINALIDITDIAKAYNKECEKHQVEGYLLEARIVSIKISGVEKRAYEFIHKPLMYEYNQITGQIITVNPKLLKTKVNKTEDVIVIRDYLIRQIEGIKKKRNACVSYDGIYEELALSELEGQAFKEKTKQVRKHVRNILEEWIEYAYITGFNEYLDGRRIKGIEITV